MTFTIKLTEDEFEMLFALIEEGYDSFNRYNGFDSAQEAAEYKQVKDKVQMTKATV